MPVAVTLLSDQIDIIVIATLDKAHRKLLERSALESADWSLKFKQEVEYTLFALEQVIAIYTPAVLPFHWKSGIKTHLSSGLCRELTVNELETSIELHKADSYDEGGQLMDKDLELINCLEISRAYLLTSN